MRSSGPLLLGVALTAVGVLGAGPSPASGPEELEAFGALVVGEWEATDSRHVFEWGVGRLALRSRSYFPDSAGWRLVSEGLWYWDAQESVIRGTVVADGMPFHRMAYRTRVEDDRVVHRLRTFGSGVREFVETWSFVDGQYRWELSEVANGAPEPVMSGVYQRREAADRP